MEDNNLSLILRAHQLAMDGYTEHFGGKVVTVWSAPDYCDRFKNIASILEIDENLQKVYKMFEKAPRETNEVNNKDKIENFTDKRYFV